jgi:hypothetical protein
MRLARLLEPDVRPRTDRLEGVPLLNYNKPPIRASYLFENPPSLVPAAHFFYGIRLFAPYRGFPAICKGSLAAPAENTTPLAGKFVASAEKKTEKPVYQ